MLVYHLRSGDEGDQILQKKHNAKHLFLTPQAADQNRAHPGDNSRLVSVQLSNEKFDELFESGSTEAVDLREI